MTISDIWTQSNKEKLFSIFIFILAMYSVVLSGTRIALVICIVLFFSVMFIWSIRGTLTKKRLIVNCNSVSFNNELLSVNNKTFSNRIDVAFNEIKTYSMDTDSYGL